MMKNFEQFIKESSESKGSELFFEDVESQLDTESDADPDIIDDIKKVVKKAVKKAKEVITPDDKKSDKSQEKTEPKKTEGDKKDKGGLLDYLEAIAFKECSGIPTKINSSGYMGKYQFSKESLNDVLKVKSGEDFEKYKSRISTFMPSGFGSVENFYNRSKKVNESLTTKDVNFFRSKFRSKGLKFWTEEKQDKAMIQLLKNNFDYLDNYLGDVTKYKDSIKKGIKLTISGMLAGAHLVGPKAVRDFIKSGIIKKDGNGTPITEYMKKFGGYKFFLP